jgi:hypothetical protein
MMPVMRNAACAAAVVLCALSCQLTGRGARSLPVTAGGDNSRPALGDTFLRDIGNASRIINDNDLILNLTHLQAMNGGGRKYYLLERDTISYMLSSVTQNLYRDIILVNWGGTVVYTMSDDGIFSKNVNEMDPASPLRRAFTEGMTGRISVERLIGETAAGGGCCYIASPLMRREKISGVIILKTGTEVLGGAVARVPD